MAVVKTDNLYFNGRNITRKISCNSKGVFSTQLPAEVVSLLGVRSTVESETLPGVEREWSKLIGQFNDAQTTTRKVIICKFKASAKIFRDELCVFNENDISFTNGVATDFMAGVYIETTVRLAGDKKNLNYAYEKSDIPNSFYPDRMHMAHDVEAHYIVLDWTEEREGSIADLCFRLEELILRLSDIFSDKKKLLKMISKSDHLLPG